MKIRKSPNKRLLRAAGMFQPWDYGFMLEMEYESLRRMKEYFGNDDNCHLINYPSVYKYINIAMKLLGFILEKEKPSVMHMNLRNILRFHPKEDETFENAPEFILDLLYKEKAWALYHKIRYETMRTWWD